MTEATHTTGLPEDIAGIFRLDGRKAVVTGAASGLGRAMALGFAHFGADVACLDIDVEGARGTAKGISELGRQSVAVGVDVRDWEGVSIGLGWTDRRSDRGSLGGQTSVHDGRDDRHQGRDRLHLGGHGLHRWCHGASRALHKPQRHRH